MKRVLRFERLFWILALVTVVSVSVVHAATTPTTTKVRIVARVSEENGRIEFGLRHEEKPMSISREAVWSDPILPASRFFPESATPGRWLQSSEVVIEGTAYFDALHCYGDTSSFFSCHGFDGLSNIDAIDWLANDEDSDIWADFFSNVCNPYYLGQEREQPGSGETTPDVLGWNLDRFSVVGQIIYPYDFGQDYSIWAETPNTRGVYAAKEVSGGSGNSVTVFFQCRTLG